MKIFFLVLTIIPYTILHSGPTDSLEGSISEIAYYAEIDQCSKYIFRGLIQNDNYVVQPTVSASYKNLNAGIWSNISTHSVMGEPALSEYDVFISHEFELYGININNTAAMYVFTGKNNYPTTTEYIIRAEYNTGPVGYTSEIAVDIMEYAGAFIITQGINYEKKFSKKLFLNTTLSLSWAGSKYNFVNIGLEKNAFNFASLDISCTYYIKKNIYLKPHFQYNKLIDKELHEFIDDHNTFFGILIGCSI